MFLLGILNRMCSNNKIIAHQLGCESSSVQIKYPKETVICISFASGQACLSFVVYGILSTVTVSKLTELGLNRAGTATVRNIGKCFIHCQLERVGLYPCCEPAHAASCVSLCCAV